MHFAVPELLGGKLPLFARCILCCFCFACLCVCLFVVVVVVVVVVVDDDVVVVVVVVVVCEVRCFSRQPSRRIAFNAPRNFSRTTSRFSLVYASHLSQERDFFVERGPFLLR